MMMQLCKWKKNKRKKPLIIKGNRQVGKTYLVREFAKEQYKNLIEINFEQEKEYIDIFNRTSNAQELLQYLQMSFLDIEFDETLLLFLDELQACPTAITALKFMSEVFPCDIICSGSALGVAIASTSSFPVGYVETWTLYPMSFIEFLYALGFTDAMLETIKDSLTHKKALPDLIHEKLNGLFQTYMITGGMPEVVAEYCESKSFVNTLKIQRRIVSDYMNDMLKYAPANDRIKARECFSSIPIQLAKENKKFQYKVVKEGYPARYYESSLRWLEDSDLIIKVHRLKSIQKPLKAYEELSIFKVYMADTGLLVSQFDDGDIKELIQGEMGIYKGALYENITAQIFQRAQKKCYYYEPNPTTEIDFIIYYDGDITPIEIKSSRNTKSKSLQNFVEKYQSKRAYRFSMKNIGSISDQRIEYLPMYALEFMLEQEEVLIQ